MGILSRLRRINSKAPDGFRFSRPLVLIQSDDWGRVGVRDREGWEELRAAGINLGERPYDFYSLETAEDVRVLTENIMTIRDSAGQKPCVTMNFVVCNLKFGSGSVADENSWLPLADGLPGHWARPGLLDAYREGIAAGVFSPALHGGTHFCLSAVTRALDARGERRSLLEKLWKAETPYIHWRMPWVGFEYWDPEETPSRRFIPGDEQRERIRWAVQSYCKLFGSDPVSACAPGYRADKDTHTHWQACGVRVVQDGPGRMLPPHFDDRGLLHTYRSVDFEPALKPELRWEDCAEEGAKWLLRGMPLVISVHSINFHSTLAGFRHKTVLALGEFLKHLKLKFSDLLFVNERQLLQIVDSGSYESRGDRIPVTVSRIRGQV